MNESNIHDCPIWPIIQNDGFIALRYHSVTNPWIDFVIFVNKADREEASMQIKLAMGAYWDCEFETYGDALNYFLNDIPHITIFHDSEDKSPEYENIWDQLLEDIDEFTEVSV